jgi:hypothetical protein
MALICKSFVYLYFQLSDGAFRVRGRDGLKMVAKICFLRYQKGESMLSDGSVLMLTAYLYHTV